VQGLFGPDGTPGEDHFQCFALAHQLWQPLRSPVPRDDAETDLRQAEPGCRRSNADVGCHREFQPPAERVAVDGCNDGLCGPLHPIEQALLSQRSQLAALLRIVSREFLDIRSGDEGLLSGPGQRDDAHLGPFLRLFDGCSEFRNDGRVERIERFRPVDGQREQAIIEVFEDVRHGGEKLQRPRARPAC
jgi:hypothetical protein